jgi:hypothetical protein
LEPRRKSEPSEEAIRKCAVSARVIDGRKPEVTLAENLLQTRLSKDVRILGSA